MISKFDIYGSPYSLKINQQTKFKSTSGGILSIITMIILVYSIIAFGKDFYNRKSPKTFVEDRVDLSIENIDLESTNNKSLYLILRVGLAFRKALVMKFIKSSGEIIAFQQCSKNELNYLGLRQYYSTIDFCLNLRNELDTINYSGGITTAIGDIIQISHCTAYKTCNIVHSNAIPISVLMPMINFNSDNYDNGMEEQYEIVNTLMFSPGIYSNMSILGSLSILSDDKSMLIDDPIQTRKLGFISLTEKYNNPTSYSVTEISFSLSKTFKYSQREFMKFQNFLAIIGGFMKLILILVETINNLLKLYFIDMYFILSSFKFYESFDDEEKAMFHTDKRKSKLRGSNAATIAELKEFSNDKKPDASKCKLVQTADQRYKERKCWFLLYLRSQINLFCGKRVRLVGDVGDEDLFKFQCATEVCNQTRGVDYLSNKLFEVEVLKTLLLNDKQILAMSMIERPYLTKNNSEYSTSILKTYRNLLRSKDENEEEVVNYFSDLLIWGNMDELSKKDLDLMNSLSEKLRIRINKKYLETIKRFNNSPEDLSQISSRRSESDSIKS